MNSSPKPLPELSWSPWVPLDSARRDAVVPARAGLYMIRSVETQKVLYVGQTGRTLKERLGALKGVYSELMPYNDPHTAGPALWAHRADTGETFEVRVAVLEVDKADRMGREALEVTKQRIIDGCSPAYNFGRMPHGWIKSTGNNRRLVEAGRRFRGRRMTNEELTIAEPDESVPPPTTLDGDVRAADWMGLHWRDAEDLPPTRTDLGVYRIDRAGSIHKDPNTPLDYLGQGLIASRLRSHAMNWAVDLAAERDDTTMWDWVALTLTPHQLLEVENDLIAGHMHVFAQPPRVQFGRG